MKIKTAEITIDNAIEERIISNWKKVIQENNIDREILDAPSFALKLRVPINLRDSLIHITIPSRLVMDVTGLIVIAKIQSDISKLIVLSLILGILTASVFYLVNDDLMWSICILVLVLGICFTFLFKKLATVSVQLLERLTSTNIK